MIYMVEMNLIDKDSRKDWDNWYEAHTNMLLTFPGFHATQRFECMTDAKAPFVALHHVDGHGFKIDYVVRLQLCMYMYTRCHNFLVF